MGEHKKPRSTILNLNGRPVESGKPVDPAIYGAEPRVMSIEDALRADIEELRVHYADVVGAVQIHHRTLQELVALVNSLEDRTVRGRIRRLRAWVELHLEAIRQLVAPEGKP